LQIISAGMFRHPSTLDEGPQPSIIIGFAKSLPTVLIIVQPDQFLSLADGLQCVAVNFLTINRLVVARAIVQVQSAVIIEEESGIPSADWKCCFRFGPVIFARIGAFPNWKRVGVC